MKKSILSLAVVGLSYFSLPVFAQAQTCERGEVCPSSYLFCKFNTFASDYNFLELASTVNAPVTGTLTFLSSSGAQVAGPVSFSLSPFSRQDFDVHSVVGKSQYGQVMVGVNAEIGDINGAISYYKSNRGDLLETVSIPCAPRDNSEVSTPTRSPNIAP